MDESVGPGGSRHHHRLFPSCWLQYRRGQLARRSEYFSSQKKYHYLFDFQVIKNFCNESVQSRYGVILQKNGLDFLWSTIVAIFLVGGTVGSLGGSYFADKVGRKGALIVSSGIGTLAGVLFFVSKTANSIEMLIAGRLLVGVSSGLITSVMPMYLTELAPSLLRGSMGVLCPLGVTFGVLVGQVLSLYKILGNEEFWPHLLAFYLLPLLLCSFLLIFLPESPKYLFIVKKQPHLAIQRTYLSIHKTNTIDTFFQN